VLMQVLPRYRHDRRRWRSLQNGKGNPPRTSCLLIWVKRMGSWD